MDTPTGELHVLVKLLGLGIIPVPAVPEPRPNDNDFAVNHSEMVMRCKTLTALVTLGYSDNYWSKLFCTWPVPVRPEEMEARGHPLAAQPMLSSASRQKGSVPKTRIYDVGGMNPDEIPGGVYSSLAEYQRADREWVKATQQIKERCLWESRGFDGSIIMIEGPNAPANVALAKGFVSAATIVPPPELTIAFVRAARDAQCDGYPWHIVDLAISMNDAGNYLGRPTGIKTALETLIGAKSRLGPAKQPFSLMMIEAYMDSNMPYMALAIGSALTRAKVFSRHKVDSFNGSADACARLLVLTKASSDSVADDVPASPGYSQTEAVAIRLMKACTVTEALSGSEVWPCDAVSLIGKYNLNERYSTVRYRGNGIYMARTYFREYRDNEEKSGAYKIPAGRAPEVLTSEQASAALASRSGQVVMQPQANDVISMAKAASKGQLATGQAGSVMAARIVTGSVENGPDFQNVLPLPELANTADNVQAMSSNMTLLQLHHALIYRVLSMEVYFNFPAPHDLGQNVIIGRGKWFIPSADGLRMAQPMDVMAALLPDAEHTSVAFEGMRMCLDAVLKGTIALARPSHQAALRWTQLTGRTSVGTASRLLSAACRGTDMQFCWVELSEAPTAGLYRDDESANKKRYSQGAITAAVTVWATSCTIEQATPPLAPEGMKAEIVELVTKMRSVDHTYAAN